MAKMKKDQATEISLSFILEKETKGTQRYVEDAERSERVIGTLYIRKTALEQFGGKAPRHLTVTITED